MAKSLNKSRIRHTQLVLLAAGFAILFSRPLIADDTPPSDLMDMLGTLLIIACALGRLYCTAFIGGKKNQSLVMTGPFALCRNPLYFSSFLGACGIGLMSGHLVLAAGLPIVYCLVYFPLIAREEKYLQEEFGTEYAAYCAETTRFFPSLKHYRGEESIDVNLHYLHKALKDSVGWFLALPLFELVEYLHSSGLVTPFFLLP